MGVMLSELSDKEVHPAFFYYGIFLYETLATR